MKEIYERKINDQKYKICYNQLVFTHQLIRRNLYFLAQSSKLLSFFSSSFFKSILKFLPFLEKKILFFENKNIEVERMHLKGNGLVSGVLDIYGQEMAPTCQQCAAELQYVQVQFKKSFFHNNNM